MLQFKNVCASYGNNLVLDNVSFSLVPHKLTAVIGKNGSGKSTLISCVNQSISYTGEIILQDQNIMLMSPRQRAQLIAILPQVLAQPNISVQELVAFGRNPYLDFGKRFSDIDICAIKDAICDIGIEHLKAKMVDELSGGERQKAYLAMILAQNSRVILLDEPTTYMDLEYETDFLNKLAVLKSQHKKTLMVIMHNLSQALKYADNIILLDNHKICFNGTPKDCLQNGIIEKTFNVNSHIFCEKGEEFIFFSKK